MTTSAVSDERSRICNRLPFATRRVVVVQIVTVVLRQAPRVRSMRRVQWFAVTALVLLTFWVSLPSAAEIAAGDTVTAKVLFVFDGDSMRVRVGEVEREMRLWGIDAPEHDQPHADVARDVLKQAIVGQTVTADVITVDQFERLVVRMRLNEQDVNLALITQGHAWWFRRFAANEQAYRLAEAAAKKARRGLWSDASPEAPWDYRDRQPPRE
jgi:endonuclease YncB( thermonuclease family)